MMGRTHMAIGVFTAAAGAAFAFNGVHGAEKEVINSVAMVGAAAVGALAPDLDHPTSMLTLKMAKYARILTAALIVLAIVEFHLIASLGAWIVGAVVWLAISVEHEMARKAALSVLGAGGIFASLGGYIPFYAAIALAAWCAVVAFSAHRTWSHGAPAMAMFVVAMFGIFSSLHLMPVAIGLVAGYVSHLIADGIAGGVPLLYPFKRERIGVQLVKTNSGIDHMIGMLAWVGAALVLFV